MEYLPLLPQPDITDAARAVARSATNKNTAAEAQRLLLALRSKVDKLGHFADLPPVLASAGDDDSLLMEWVFPTFRVSFNIESKLEDSSWVLVSTKEAGGLAVSGLLYPARFGLALDWILNFVKAFARRKS